MRNRCFRTIRADVELPQMCREEGAVLPHLGEQRMFPFLTGGAAHRQRSRLQGGVQTGQ